MRRLLPLSSLAAAAGLAVGAPSAPALVQLERGIAGARLGATPAEVRAALGAPARTIRGTNELGPFTELRFAGELRVVLQGGEAVSLVSTTGLGDRTASGVGVGTSARVLRARVAGLRCSTEAGVLVCARGRFAVGGRVTNFFVRRGRVVRIDVGRVVD
jgi:hypothetical protein